MEETRVAVLAIIVRNSDSVEGLNALLHQYGCYILSRMGVPYHQRGVNIISVAMDASSTGTSDRPGKLGSFAGVAAKTVHAPEEAGRAKEAGP